MNTIGHHTVQNLGNFKQLEQNGPILAEYNPVNKKLPFLGKGYYFWDYNYEMALYWGKQRYNGKCYIFEGELSVQDNLFLDLVGRRQDMELFKRLMDRFKKFNNNNDWPIGKFIEFMKNLNAQQKYNGIFPYKIIRAIDSSAKNMTKHYFSEGKKNWIELNPRMVICLIEKNNLNLTSFKLVYKN